jgi:hypothetical protein
MAYNITRTVDHATGDYLDTFFNWAENGYTVPSDVQLLYPEIDQTNYFAGINQLKNLTDPLSQWENLFTGTPGFINYSYTVNGFPVAINFTQVFSFANEESYLAWQSQEQDLGKNRILGWSAALEEKTIVFSNQRLEGKEMIDNITGTSTGALPLGRYLGFKYFTLRGTTLSVTHSVT